IAKVGGVIPVQVVAGLFVLARQEVARGDEYQAAAGTQPVTAATVAMKVRDVTRCAQGTLVGQVFVRHHRSDCVPVVAAHAGGTWYGRGVAGFPLTRFSTRLDCALTAPAFEVLASADTPLEPQATRRSPDAGAGLAGFRRIPRQRLCRAAR